MVCNQDTRHKLVLSLMVGFLFVSAVAECLRLLSIGAHFPSPEVLLPEDDITAYEYLLTLRVF